MVVRSLAVYQVPKRFEVGGFLKMVALGLALGGSRLKRRHKITTRDVMSQPRCHPTFQVWRMRRSRAGSHCSVEVDPTVG
ncbi:hypothetical protein K402DRAFT_394404 [Aulographum hederae CBS 113979]|uniref:Uncharacterized protein n=1 Tax=Aulographum hederae CBS 113979 TaxID=1176131 RepID=A0A6G1GYA1_9PEZI|nr:hypothetical protein K402DRAFT_394404 [Aulographum hederae CBS 113979]